MLLLQFLFVNSLSHALLTSTKLLIQYFESRFVPIKGWGESNTLLQYLLPHHLIWFEMSPLPIFPSTFSLVDLAFIITLNSNTFLHGPQHVNAFCLPLPAVPTPPIPASSSSPQPSFYPIVSCHTLLSQSFSKLSFHFSSNTMSHSYTAL